MLESWLDRRPLSRHVHCCTPLMLTRPGRTSRDRFACCARRWRTRVRWFGRRHRVVVDLRRRWFMWVSWARSSPQACSSAFVSARRGATLARSPDRGPRSDETRIESTAAAPCDRGPHDRSSATSYAKLASGLSDFALTMRRRTYSRATELPLDAIHQRRATSMRTARARFMLPPNPNLRNRGAPMSDMNTLETDDRARPECAASKPSASSDRG